MDNNFFPLFLDLTDSQFLVFGAGKIAARRVEVLLSFGAHVTIVSPEILPEMKDVMSKEKRGDFLKSGGKICMIKQESYHPGIIPEDVDYVLAATNDSQVNEGIFRECRHKEIMVNVASDKTLSNFHFPAIVKTEDVIIGVGSGGEDHGKVKEAAGRIRDLF